MSLSPAKTDATALELRLLIFAPSRRRASETFIRANLRGMPFNTVIYCGDEFPLFGSPLRLAYGLAVLSSKLLYRIGWQSLGTWIPSQVAIWICRYERPSVVLAEFGFHAVRIMELVPATGLPLIVHFRGADASSQRYRGVLAERYRRLLSLAEALVVKSQPMAECLLPLAKARRRPLRLLVTPSGADASLFHGAAPGQAPPLFLSVGRFVPKKGPLLTIRAFAAALDQLPLSEAASLKLVMVGDGPLLPAARRLVHQLGLGARILFPGMCSPSEIAARMRSCRAFLQHSLVAPDGDSEGSPVSVMEAQLSGLPVVSTRHAGIPEVVIEGETGLLVEEGDVAGMASAIARLAVNPALAERLGMAAALRARSNFTVAHHLEALAGLVERVVVDRRGASV